MEIGKQRGTAQGPVNDSMPHMGTQGRGAGAEGHRGVKAHGNPGMAERHRGVGRGTGAQGHRGRGAEGRKGRGIVPRRSPCFLPLPRMWLIGPPVLALPRQRAVALAASPSTLGLLGPDGSF